MRIVLAVLVLALAASDAAAQQQKKKLVCITQAVGFEHDVVKEKDGKPSVVNTTINKLADSLGLDYEHSRDASILTAEKLKDTQIVVLHDEHGREAPADEAGGPRRLGQQRRAVPRHPS